MAHRREEDRQDYFERPLDNRKARLGTPIAIDANDSEDDADGDEEDEVQDAFEEEDDEDGHGEATPLLPIFSAAHLGTQSRLHRKPPGPATELCARRHSHLQPYTLDTPPDHPALRNNTVMGSVAFSTNLPVLGQTYPATNTKPALLPRNAICSTGKLFTIQ